MGNKSETVEVAENNHEEREENRLESVEQEVLVEDKQEVVVVKKAKPLSRNEEAKALIKNSEALISEVDSEVRETKVIVAQNVANFELMKATISNSTLRESSSLLEQVNFEHLKDEVEEPFEVSLGTGYQNINVPSIRSGRFTGLLLALIGMLVTAVAWILLASAKTASYIQFDKIPDQTQIQNIFLWIGGGMTGGAGDPMFGMVTVGVSAFVVGLVIYKMRVSMKENKNFKVANKIFEESNSYVVNQQESKTEMEYVNEHIQECTPLIEGYKILLDEQNAKLKRVIFIEGTLEENSDYHSSSKEIMKNSDRLMRRVEHLISVPVTNGGRLNETSTYALIEAKALYESFLSKIYA